jgi:hypothetical protein
VSGVCGGCSTTADCNGLGTCVNSVCTSSVAGSLCR